VSGSFIAARAASSIAVPAASRFNHCGDCGPWMPIPTPSVTTMAKPRASIVAIQPSSTFNVRSKPCEKWMPWLNSRDGAHCSPAP
jgi:hypothetical protein